VVKLVEGGSRQPNIVSRRSMAQENLGRTIEALTKIGLRCDFISDESEADPDRKTFSILRGSWTLFLVS